MEINKINNDLAGIAKFVNSYSGAKKKLENLATGKISGRSVSVPTFNKKLSHMMESYKQNNSLNSKAIDFIDNFIIMASKTPLSKRDAINIINQVRSVSNDGKNFESALEAISIIAISKPLTSANCNKQIDSAIYLLENAQSEASKKKALGLLLKIGKDNHLSSDVRMNVFSKLLKVNPRTDDIYQALIQCQKANKNTRNSEFKGLLEKPIINKN